MKNNEQNQLKKTIQTRHLVMLSLGGAIGTGLFLGSGEVINQAGTLGAILAYIFWGIVTYMVMMCLGELAAYMPVSNAFSTYSSQFIGPATGYMIAWVYWLTWALTLGVDFTAAAILMGEWLPHFPIWIWIIIFSAAILMVNLYSTKTFAESEFCLSLIKVITVLIFLLAGLLVLCNIIPLANSLEYPHQYFTNFSKDNLFSNGLKGILTTMLLVSFSFTGTELIAVAAGETENPKESLPKAVKATFWRLLIMFIGTITIVAFLFPNHELGLGSDQISKSPFVLLFAQLNIPYAQDIIRLVIITALLSSANSGLYAASRMLWSISTQYNLPEWIAKLTPKGIPIYAVLITVLCTVPGGLLLKYFNAKTVLNTIIDVAAFTMVIVWMSICVAQFNFRRQLIKEKRNPKDLPYCSPCYPFLSVIGFIFLLATAFSMLLDTNKIIGCSICMLYILFCYIYYNLNYRAKCKTY